MTENLERVKQEALRLLESDRAELVRLLIESLDDSEDPDAEAEFDAELRSRVEQIEQEKSRLRPAHSVLSTIAGGWAQEVEDRVEAYERGEIEAVPAEDVFNAIKNRKL